MKASKLRIFKSNYHWFSDLDGEAYLSKSKYYQIMESKIKEFKLDQVTLIYCKG